MSRKRINKEPALLRRTVGGVWSVSREWIGWCVMGHPLHEELTGDAILDVAALKAPAFAGEEGKKAVISRDGKAIVVFVDDKEEE